MTEGPSATHDDAAPSTPATYAAAGVDIEAGERLGLLTVLVPSRGHESEVREEMSSHRAVADITAPSFLAAAVRILTRG